VENRVLLVEDQGPLRRSLESFLERAGYSFDSCATAREALTLAESQRHDVAIVEYHLPDGNGSTLLKRLTQAVPGMPVVMISAYDFQAVAKELIRSEVHSYLKKPFDPVDLEVALSSACCKARTESQSANGGSKHKDRRQPVYLPLSTSERGLIEKQTSSGAHAELS
jgi:DNA-binding NtrC family response regulator